MQHRNTTVVKVTAEEDSENSCNPSNTNDISINSNTRTTFLILM